MTDRGKRAATRVKSEHSNAVVAPVRTIDELAIGGDVDIRTRILPREILRQSSFALQLFQTPLLGIAPKNGHRRIQLVKHKDILATGMKSQMTWSRSRLDRHPGLFVRLQCSVSRVEAKNHDSVSSEIT